MMLPFRTALPVAAILFTALLSFSVPAAAQDSAPVTEVITVNETDDATELVITEESSATSASKGNFQGLIPPAGITPKVNYGAPRHDGDDTHPPIRLTPDKSELVRVDDDVASIIVGNPNHLGVLMDDPRLLILVPRQPGATYLTLLNHDGEVIMQRHVIVSIANKDYIRIRRSCAGGGGACEETSVYYCKGMCHQVDIVENDGRQMVPPPISGRRPRATADVTVENPDPGFAEQEQQQQQEQPVEPDNTEEE